MTVTAIKPPGGRPAHLPGPPFALLPIAPRDKRPLTPHGVKDATTDAGQIAAWWARWPDANVAAAMGVASGVFCIDVDPRNGGGNSLEVLMEKTGPWPLTWRSATGGGGQHFFFRLPPGMSIQNFSPLPGIDVLCENKYAILPPSVHPSGAAYQWFFDEGPDNVELAYPPPALLAYLGARSPSVARLAPPAAASSLLTAPRVQEIRSALAFVNADARDTWLQVGMALRSAAPNDQGYGLWTEWSQTSDKFNAADQARVWKSFRASSSGVTLASLFKLAYECGWPGAPALEAPSVRTRKPAAPPASSTPPELLEVPGVLGTYVRYDLATATKPNPQLAVQGALAFGSVVLSRRYVTDSRNHAALFLLSVAATGTGKEHAKAVIEKTLIGAELQHLLGGAGYSSATAMFGRLQSAPSHLAVVDEYGRMLESGRRSMSEHKLTAQTALMEVYGRGDGVLMPPNYSTRGMLPKDRREAEAALVHCPGITLLSMSTPQTFYPTLTDRSIEDGFLPRFIVVESETGRQMSQDTSATEPNDLAMDWARAVVERAIPRGNIAAYRTDEADARPELVELRFTQGAREQLRQLERRILDHQEELEVEGLAGLFGRTRENAMRLALIVSLSRDPMADVIDEISARWAIAYVEHYALQTLHSVRTRIVTGEFGAWAAEARRLVEHAGEAGMTSRELCKFSRKLRDLNERQFVDVMGSLVRSGHSAFVTLKQARGKPRQAWVLADLIEDSEQIADNADKSPTPLSAICSEAGSET